MTRQQLWSLKAHEQVRILKERQDVAKQKTFGMKMPGLIQQSGLVQALVFAQTRPGGSGTTFVDSLASVYGVDSGDALVRMAQEERSLSVYLSLTRDLLEVSIWVRRFTQIELKDIDEEE